MLFYLLRHFFQSVVIIFIIIDYFILKRSFCKKNIITIIIDNINGKDAKP